MTAVARERVVVAMSGGVDSSVVAGLLHEAGHEVVGITLQLYDHGKAVGRQGACCAGRDIADARAVADHLGIAHYVLDFEARFKAAVIDDFADSYARGVTPIPCVRCNQRIKFQDLMGIARELGAAALATGHYVRRIRGPDGPELHRAADRAKDQSYFLFATTPAQLAFLRFPLGDLTKAATRAAAARLSLPVAAKPESQDICFVPDGDYARIVARLRPEAATPGEIVDETGRVLGSHRGIGHFTVGQRRGLGIALGQPLYVTRLDVERRRVVVAPRGAGLSTAAELAEVNWLGPTPAADVPVTVKHRYNEPAVPARLEPTTDGGVRVVFQDPQPGVAPGQAGVVYDGQRLLGGGWIARTLRLDSAQAAA